jgi:hypothetical protein
MEDKMSKGKNIKEGGYNPPPKVTQQPRVTPRPAPKPSSAPKKD